MKLDECLSKMVAPGQVRPSKPYRGGVIQIHVTRACDKACFACTQGSNLGGKTHFMPPTMFEDAVRSLGFPGKGAYFGVVGVFGGNPALSPHFEEYCDVLCRLVPFEQRGLWCNHPVTVDRASIMRATFNPAYSNINVHLDEEAAAMFRKGWPEAHIVGKDSDCRHSPVHLAAKDVVKLPSGEPDMDRIWEAVSTCDVNQRWSAMLCMFRNKLRAFFCEVAGAQAILHQDDPSYPDTGIDVLYTRYVDRSNPGMGEEVPWWKCSMPVFAEQVEKHCPECFVPFRAYGELSQAENGEEWTSETHAGIFKPKRRGREVRVATELTQLGLGRIKHVTDYMQNARK